MLTYLVKEVEQLVSSSAWYQPDVSQCQQCGRSDGDILQLESQLHLTQEAADRLQRHLSDKSDELKRRIEDNNNCQNQAINIFTHLIEFNKFYIIITIIIFYIVIRVITIIYYIIVIIIIILKFKN